MQFNGPDKKETRRRWLSLKYAFMVKQNERWTVGATKIQPDGSDKKGIRKKRLILKYNYSSGKMKQKM